MPAIKWLETTMGTGVESVDDQHRELIRMLNELLIAVHQQRGKDEVVKMLEFLGDYTKTHFSHEESVMASCNCAVAEENKQAHSRFLAEYAAMVADFEKDGLPHEIVIRVQHKVVRWLMNHIMGCDTQLRECTVARSV